MHAAVVGTADQPIPNKKVDSFESRMKALLVAYKDAKAVLSRHSQQGPTFLEICCHRFLDKEVLALRESRVGNFEVRIRRGRYDDRCKSGRFVEFSEVPVGVRYAPPFLCVFQSSSITITNRQEIEIVTLHQGRNMPTQGGYPNADNSNPDARH